MPSREKKEQYFETLKGHLSKYNNLFLVSVDHVGSKLMSDIRYMMRGRGDVLMGKNTMMRKCIMQYCEANPESKWMNLIPLLKGNVGFVFCNKDAVGEARSIIQENTVPAPAKVGMEAQCDVYVPPGPTGCDPSQTSYFQAMNVPTKISRGQIEITGQMLAVEKGKRVNAGAADLLAKLGICPFTFGLIISKVYDNGSVYDAAVLDLDANVIQAKFMTGARNVAAVSIACAYPTLASVPHSLALGVKMCCALIGGAESDYTFAKGATALLFMKDPAAALAAAAASSGPAAAEEKKEEEEEEEEEAPEVQLGGDDGW